MQRPRLYAELERNCYHLIPLSATDPRNLVDVEESPP
jgi:hypothetical protein